MKISTFHTSPFALVPTGCSTPMSARLRVDAALWAAAATAAKHNVTGSPPRGAPV